MESVLASPADADIILKLYDLRREAVMREARAWLLGEFWPESVEDYLAVAMNPSNPKNPFIRQVNTYWEMAAAFVLHGAVSADLFCDCNAEGFFLLAKYSPFLDAMVERNPHFMSKTRALVQRFPAAAARYEVALRNAANLRAMRKSKSDSGVGYAYPPPKP